MGQERKNELDSKEKKIQHTHPTASTPLPVAVLFFLEKTVLPISPLLPRRQTSAGRNQAFSVKGQAVNILSFGMVSVATTQLYSFITNERATVDKACVNGCGSVPIKLY